MFRFFVVSFIFFLSSCASLQVNGEARLRFLTAGELLKKCSSLTGKEVAVEGTYMGWSCPQNCRHPGITRSDSCLVDSTGCIYISGTGGLDPITDRGKRIRVKGVVSLNRGVCYLKPERVDELR